MYVSLLPDQILFLQVQQASAASQQLVRVHTTRGNLTGEQLTSKSTCKFRDGERVREGGGREGE